MNSLIIIVFSEGGWCLLLTFWESVFGPREHRGGTVGTSGAPWGATLTLWDHPGGPWEQQDGFEVANNRIFVDFGMILKLFMAGFGNQNAYKFVFWSGLFAAHLFINF